MINGTLKKRILASILDFFYVILTIKYFHFSIILYLILQINLFDDSGLYILCKNIVNENLFKNIMSARESTMIVLADILKKKG